MQPTPTTRGRHALRWVLGVGIVFVLVVAMALQVARERAEVHWDTVLAHLEEEGIVAEALAWRRLSRYVRPETRSGNCFREGRERYLLSPILVLRQERNFFGSSIEAHLADSLQRVPEHQHGLWTEWVEHMHKTFSAVDVALVVEP